MENKNLSLREEDSILLARIYKSMTSKGRNLLMDKYGFEDQRPLKGKTEAYHFQFYKSELFNNAQKEKLGNLLRSRGIASGIRFIEQLPTASTTKPETVEIVFECFAEAKGISQPECLLEFLELCDGKNFPLVAFEKDKHDLKITIEGLKKYIADSKNKTHPEKNPPVENGGANAGAIKNPSSNIVPVTGETKWLDPYNFDEIRLVGREKEIDLLNKFIESEGQFKIWAIAGPSGAGKTRLASQWAYESSFLKGWDCRVLHKEDRIESEKWSNWAPDKPTLLIIDYMYGFDEVILKLMNHRLKPDVPKIRLLLIDHVFSDPLHSDKRWGFSGDASSLNRNEKYFFNKKPIDLRQTENQKQIIQSIIAHRAQIDVEDSQAIKASEYLENTQGAYHPLFAALVGDVIKSGEDFTVWNRRKLIDYYLVGSHRLPWEHKSKIGLLASYFIAGATARRGMNYDDLFKAVEDHDLSPDDSVQVEKICQRVIANDNEHILAPFEPDILGESFFLKFLQYLKYASKQQKEFRKVLMAGNEDTQTKDAIEFIAFIQRLTRNLLNDDRKQRETQALWNALFSFMTSSNFGDSERFEWAVSAGLINIVDAIRDQFPEEETAALLNKVDPAVLHRDTNENSLMDSVIHSMRYLELIHRDGETPPVLSEEILALFDRFTVRNVDGETPLMLASFYAFNNVINSLIARKMNIEAKLSGGQSALMAASSMGHIETIKCLLNAEANIHATDNDGRTALIWGSIFGNIETVRLLLDRGADIHSATSDGRTALIAASINGNVETVRLLLDQAAKIDIAENDGRTALIAASSKNHVETVRMLLDNGAKVDASDTDGRTGLIYASSNGYVETVGLLLDKGAQIDTADNEGMTALILASNNGHIKTVDLLLNKGANIHCTQNDGYTALMCASGKGYMEMIRLLIDKGAKVDVVDNDGHTPLIWACAAGHVEAVRLLLNRGANVHVTNNTGITALFWACLNNHIGTVELLLNRKARVDVVDNNGQTALSIAQAKGHEEIVQLLVQHGAQN
jgi:ankyrin repeat protein